MKGNAMPALPKQPKPHDKYALRVAWTAEIDVSRHARARGDADAEWTHLERAHVLSQPLPAAHVRTHLAMLAVGIRHRDMREIAGQLVRLAVAGPGSASRRYPVGNTGGSNVSATAPMPIAADLRAVLDLPT
ncbi:MAG: DUF3703 domain-containing protein [Acidimicrobiia bacterium]